MKNLFDMGNEETFWFTMAVFVIVLVGLVGILH